MTHYIAGILMAPFILAPEPSEKELERGAMGAVGVMVIKGQMDVGKHSCLPNTLGYSNGPRGASMSPPHPTSNNTHGILRPAQLLHLL